MKKQDHSVSVRDGFFAAVMIFAPVLTGGGYAYGPEVTSEFSSAARAVAKPVEDGVRSAIASVQSLDLQGNYPARNKY